MHLKEKENEPEIRADFGLIFLRTARPQRVAPNCVTLIGKTFKI
jgi:hypothetical protein